MRFYIIYLVYLYIMKCSDSNNILTIGLQTKNFLIKKFIFFYIKNS